jgi:hypothetical protein
MGTPVISQQTTVMCGHGGSATPAPTQVRVKILGALAAIANDVYSVAGCALTGTGTPPCLVLQWLMPAMRVKIQGMPVLLNASMPMATGPGVVIPGQVRVMAT